MFFGQAARYGERPLVHHLVGEQWKTETWADMKRYVLAVASALVDAGLKQGDRVVLLGENRYEWLVSDFGIQAAGGVAVPVYTGTAPEVIQKIVDNSEAVLAIASTNALAGKLRVGGSMKKVVTIDTDVTAWMARRPQRLAEVATRLRRSSPTTCAPSSTRQAPPAIPRASSSRIAAWSTSAALR